MVLNQIFIKAHVLFFCENGIVGLNFILLEKSLIPTVNQLASSLTGAGSPLRLKRYEKQKRVNLEKG
jgi:hypothetical protein